MRILVAGWDSGGGVEALVVDEPERAALERPAVSH